MKSAWRLILYQSGKFFQTPRKAKIISSFKKFRAQFSLIFFDRCKRALLQQKYRYCQNEVVVNMKNRMVIVIVSSYKRNTVLQNSAVLRAQKRQLLRQIFI